MPSDRVILCLRRAGDLAEALAVRDIEANAVIAVSGVAAGRRGEEAPKIPAPRLDARAPSDLARLTDLVLGPAAQDLR